VKLVTAADDTNTSTLISLGFPSWLHARRYDIILKKACQGWDSYFRTYRTVDLNAAVFHYSMDGDVAGLQRLFERGEASPNDIDPEGRTPLHVRRMQPKYVSN
jgi:hypothetical protein